MSKTKKNRFYVAEEDAVLEAFSKMMAVGWNLANAPQNESVKATCRVAFKEMERTMEKAMFAFWKKYQNANESVG